MKLNDSGFVVQYIYSLLQKSSTLFQQTYHIGNRYTPECHQILCDYYRSLAYLSDGTVNTFYEDMLSMMNLWTGYMYDEKESELDIFGGGYRCFIIPVSPKDSSCTSGCFYCAGAPEGTTLKYRYTSRPSIYKIITDSSSKSEDVWSTESTTSDTIDCSEISDKGWTYLIVGVPLGIAESQGVKSLMVSHHRDSSLYRSISSAFASDPWIVNDEFIPYLLDRCITPESHMDDIWFLQKTMVNAANYKIATAGIWDSSLQWHVLNLQQLSNSTKDVSADEVFLYGYLTPSAEIVLENLLMDEGKEMSY